MKRNEPRRHHYVPEFYQKGFADTDGCLWLYDRRAQKYAKANPRNICCEKDLYTIDPEGRKSRYVELEWLSRVDRDGASAIRRFRNGVQLEEEWREAFSIFMAQQITRTPVFRDLTNQNYRAMREEYLRIGFTDVDRARHLLENYRAQTGDMSHPDVTVESLVEGVVGGHVAVTVDEEPFLTHMVRQVEFLARWLVTFEWEILRASVEQTGFVVCDYPFVLVPSRERPEAIGLGFPGTVKYFPLTRALCLRMGEQGYGFCYRTASKEEVRIINQNIAVNSERFIMGASQRQLEHVIARSGTMATDPAPRTKVDVVRENCDSSLIGFNFWARRSYFYPKS